MGTFSKSKEDNNFLEHNGVKVEIKSTVVVITHPNGETETVRFKMQRKEQSSTINYSHKIYLNDGCVLYVLWITDAHRDIGFPEEINLDSFNRDINVHFTETPDISLRLGRRVEPYYVRKDIIDGTTRLKKADFISITNKGE